MLVPDCGIEHHILQFVGEYDRKEKEIGFRLVEFWEISKESPVKATILIRLPSDQVNPSSYFSGCGQKSVDFHGYMGQDGSRSIIKYLKRSWMMRIDQ